MNCGLATVSCFYKTSLLPAFDIDSTSDRIINCKSLEVIMTQRMLVGSLALIAGFGQAAASVITPADFGSAAQVQTFDSLPVGGSADPLVLNGVTYSFSPGGHYILAANPVNYVCISGNCLSN